MVVISRVTQVPAVEENRRLIDVIREFRALLNPDEVTVGATGVTGTMHHFDGSRIFKYHGRRIAGNRGKRYLLKLLAEIKVRMVGVERAGRQKGSKKKCS
jgi:hypothetical protein